MNSLPLIAIKYAQHLLKANNKKGHSIHSPFMFSFITDVVNDDREFYPFKLIEEQRKYLLHDNREIEVLDYGAGSRKSLTKNRLVNKIAATSLKPKRYGQLFFRIINYYGYKNILELGTCLGITSAYLASANTNALVNTFEGAPNIAAIAQTFFSAINLKNISIIEGNFDHTLPSFLKNSEQIDFVYIDGNHQYKPTIDYFNMLLPKLSKNAVLVFDDIYWSKEMETAWKEIKEKAPISISVDMFHLGFLFFSENFKQKEHFVLKY